MNLVNKLFDLSGKTALITGASSGLGEYFAEILAGAGAQVVITARRLDRLEALAERIKENGGQAIPLACDVDQADQVAAVVEEAWQRCGRIDIVVNNAGQVGDGGFVPEKLPHEVFEATLKTNLTGLWYCCQEAGKRMLADGAGGSIINLTSVLGMGGSSDHPLAYQASKSAVINLTRNLACSWADRGIRVNALAPAYFPSEMTGPYLAVPGYETYINNATPLGRLGTLEELAGPLLMLASDAGSYLTGITLPVDGGYSAGVGHSHWTADIYEGLSNVIPNQGSVHITAKE
ncbi:MAG: SDR family oxidoreductase [Pseudomonadales bacterium]|jgi:NAD(P)-dependent dehydrogenase (short-subunit alcohol dehydrogenase family)|nr:SDR family oxidoreductase [Pseudomonadales bacterium]MDA0958336.1 SDR family oxidoreductase [Pseudomonadota bacterium]